MVGGQRKGQGREKKDQADQEKAKEGQRLRHCHCQSRH